MLDDLKAEVRAAVQRYCHHPVHRQAALAALAQPGFALHAESPCRAGVLCFEASETVLGGSRPAALLAAAGVELYLEASFLFDGVADGELGPGDGTPAEALATAVALMNCGAGAACEAVGRSPRGPSALGVLQGLFRDCVSACSGQFLDAQLEGRDKVTSDEAITMTALKAGSCGKLAASFGVGLSTDDAELTSLFGELGFNLFTYAQLVDDLMDACPAEGPIIDAARGKKTVPLVYFSSSVGSGRNASANGIMLPNPSERERKEFIAAYDASEASIFGAVVAEAYLNLAKKNLANIRVRLGKVEGLERLVSSVESVPQGIIAAP